MVTVDLSEGRDNVPATEFKHILGAEGSTHAVDPVDNNTIYSSTFYGALARAEINNYPAKYKKPASKKAAGRRQSKRGMGCSFDYFKT